MTQKLYDLSRWVRMSPGKAHRFRGVKPRTVTVEVNAPQESAIYLGDHDGELHFLALVKGRDKLEFGAEGPFELMTNEGDVFIYSSDGDAVHSELDAPESFVKVMQRRVRNPELEAMMRTMQSNFQRQLEKQMGHYDQLIARSLDARAALAAAPVPVAGAAPKQEPAGDAGSDGDAPAAADGGGKGKA